MLFKVFLQLVLTALSVQALDPFCSLAKQSRANDEVPTATAIIGSTHTNTLAEHTTLIQQSQRSEAALTSATVATASNLNRDVRRDLQNTDMKPEVQMRGEKDQNSAVESGSGVGKRFARKAAEHLDIRDTTSSNTERKNRLPAQSRRVRIKAHINGRNTDESAKCDCSGKVSGTYRTATIVLGVIIGLEVLFALLSVCFRSLFRVLVGLFLG